MMAAEGNNIRTYIYRGEEAEDIPRYGHQKIIVIVHEDVTVILEGAFEFHRKICAIICHDKVEKIGEAAFFDCPSLRRAIMPGVKIVEDDAFNSCTALTDMERADLEIMGERAFNGCKSLRSINLPSVEIVDDHAFGFCEALTEAKFSNKLERIKGRAFLNCTFLERVTIPLKDALITGDSVFMGCENLKHVDLVEGELHETISALQLEEWRRDMSELIDSINQILPDTDAGFFIPFGDHNEGEKARVIRSWISSVLRRIIHYQAEHQRVVNEAGSTLHHALPHDIVMNYVLPFLALPSHTFEVEDDEDEESDSDDEDEMVE